MAEPTTAIVSYGITVRAIIDPDILEAQEKESEALDNFVEKEMFQLKERVKKWANENTSFVGLAVTTS